MTLSTNARVVILGACLLVSAGALARASRTEPTAARMPLSQLPMELDGFTGSKAADLEPEVLAVLGLDDWLNRTYRPRAGGPFIGLYIGYWGSQREGDTIHSPMNCLPGAGWQPVQGGPVDIQVNGVPRNINRYIIEKSGEQMLVLYWYQSHGRAVASEYWGKIHMVLDAVRLNRTDAGLVRVIVPIGRSDPAAEADADKIALDFIRQLFPRLDTHIPA